MLRPLNGLHRRSNCLIFAIGLRLAFGGRIRAMRSRNYPGPHFLWEGRRYVIDLVPVAPVPRVVPPLVFDGVVRVRAREEAVQ